MIQPVGGALAGYVLGLVVHELVHVAVAWLVGAPVTDIELSRHHLTVHYDPPSARADRMIRAAPVVVAWGVVVVAAVGAARSGRLDGWLVATGLIVGFFPRSRTDWTPVLRHLPRATF